MILTGTYCNTIVINIMLVALFVVVVVLSGCSIRGSNHSFAAVVREILTYQFS